MAARVSVLVESDALARKKKFVADKLEILATNRHASVKSRIQSQPAVFTGRNAALSFGPPPKLTNELP